MSTIQELLRELCPNGVEHRTLGEVAKCHRGTAITAKQSKPGSVPVVSGGQKPAFFHAESNRPSGCVTVAGSGAYAGYVQYWDVPIFCADSFTVDPIDSDEISSRFIFHILKSRQDRLYSLKSEGGVPHVYGKDVAAFSIPLPPLSVQEEIVRRLDAMQDVVEALETELALRRKQYEAVRKEVLDSLFVAEERTIGECCSIVNAHVKFQRSEYGKEGAYPIIDQGQDFICGYTDDASSIMDIGPCVLFGDHTRIVKYADFPFAQGADGLKILKAEEQTVTPRFLFHSLSSADIPNRGYNRHWTMAKDIRIPVPPLPVQKEIAKKLDAFDELVNVALPAEIAARRRAMETVRERCFAALEKAG